MAKRKAKRKDEKQPPDQEEAPVKIEFQGATFLWNGKYYVNLKTGIIAPTKVHQNLDEIRLKTRTE